MGYRIDIRKRIGARGVDEKCQLGHWEHPVADYTLTGASGVRARIRSAAFSAIMITGALMLPPTRSGITEASTMRSASTPRTLSSGSTTAAGSLGRPILQVPSG